MKIETILFDMGKVLVYFSFETAVKALHICCSISRDQLEDLLSDETSIRRYERGEISTNEFYTHLRETASLTMDLPQFCQTWSSVFLPGMMVSEKLLASLQEKYPPILVSNTNEAHVEFIRSKYRIFEYFDHHVLSYEVGSLKPEVKIFEHAIAVSGYPAEALFFTDDREENILVSRQLGINAHQFVSAAKLIAALREVGVDVGNNGNYR